MRSLKFAVALLSASALAFEVLLTRLFSITHWHHFAYLVISLSLLGYGVSGTFLTLMQKWVLPRWRISFVITALGFSLSCWLCFAGVQRLDFNPLEMLWSLKPWWALLKIYLLLLLPFFFAANGIGIALSRFPKEVHRLYRFDLMGAGVGAFGIILLLQLFFPERALQGVGGSGILAAVLVLWRPGWGRRVALILLAATALLVYFFPHHWVTPRMSPFKALSQTLEISGTRVLWEGSSPLARLHLVASPQIPFRHAPGLSLSRAAEPPEQLGLFVDGGGPNPIHRFDGDFTQLKYLAGLSQALPYTLLKNPEVLILGAGGGSDILMALYYGATRVDAVELNPQILKLLQDEYQDYSGGLFQNYPAHPIVGEARSFAVQAKSKPRRWDLIQISLLDSYGAASAGLYSLNESYLYTTEAISDYLKLLNEDGVLAITRWLKLPPRDSLKLSATAAQALRGMGLDPKSHLALIRSWKTVTLIVVRSPLSPAQVEALKDFSQSRSFDLIYYPGISAEEANRFNQLERAFFYEGVQKILQDDTEFFENYKFSLRPATDDRPFFFHFLKLSSLPELWSLRGQGGIGLIEQGYPLLWATLLQALALSVVLILLPLFFFRGSEDKHEGRIKMIVYFLFLGLAFLALEITFIQRFFLFVGQPLYTIAVVVAGFLVFAGWGSGWSARWAKGNPGRGVFRAVLAIALIAMAYHFLLPWIFAKALALATPWRILITLATIAPLGFFMGMPFPLGLSLLRDHRPQWIPWAWGINGCASVLSAILATLAALHWGFSTVLFLVLGLYLGSGFLVRRKGF